MGAAGLGGGRDVDYNGGPQHFPEQTMVLATPPAVTAGAYLTLHYRLSAGGVDIVSTFQTNPATLQLGSGQLAPFLETCLIGMGEGGRQTFELPPEQAYGARNPELLRRVSRGTLGQHAAPDETWTVGDVVDFAPPGGGRFAGVLRELDADGALFDFNHPLAGQALTFEVEVIGIL